VLRKRRRRARLACGVDELARVARRGLAAMSALNDIQAELLDAALRDMRECPPGRLSARSFNSLRAIEERLGSLARDVADGRADRIAVADHLQDIIARAGLAPDDAKGDGGGK
jgi:hypothetical protein